MSSQLDQFRLKAQINPVVVFLGSELFAPSFGHDQSGVLDVVKNAMSDTNGWDTFNDNERIHLAELELGRDVIIQKFASHFPYQNLEQNELFSTLGDFRPKYVVDLNFHHALESFALESGGQWRRIMNDEDLDFAPYGIPPSSFYKLRGDIWTGGVNLTVDDLASWRKKESRVFDEIHYLCRMYPVILLGFSPRDQVLKWLQNAFELERSSVLSFFVSTNKNLKKWNQNLGFLTVSAPTRVELSQRVLDFFEFSSKFGRSPSNKKSSKSILTENQSKLIAHIEVSDSKNKEELRNLKHEVCEAIAESIIAFQGGHRFDPNFLSSCMAFLTRSGFVKDGTSLVEYVCEIVLPSPQTSDHSLSILGQSLMRMGDEWRGYLVLRNVLLSGNLDEREQANALAWVSKAALTRIEDLMMKSHQRAATEQIAQFLNTFAKILSVGNQSSEDKEMRWSLYYINLRLGRIMMLASSMAGSSNSIYAEQAVNLLLKTIELVPEKPDGYKFLRPLLNDRESPKYSESRWLKLIDNAPEGIRKKFAS